MSFFIRSTPIKNALKKRGLKKTGSHYPRSPFFFPEIDMFDNFLRAQPSFLRMKNLDTEFNIRENDTNLVISSPLPRNIGKDNIKVEVNKESDGSHWLDIQISKKDEVRDEDGNSYKKFSSRIQKSYHLDPSLYNLEKTNAHIEDDNLLISIPKNVESTAHKINVKINEGRKAIESETSENKGSDSEF